MNSILALLRQLWGLFVDDGSLACALVIWCAGAGLFLPRLVPFSDWNAPILFIGCVAILIANIAMATWNYRSRGQQNRKEI